MKSDRQPVDLVILCGFLGSGKTTLLLDFLRQTEGMSETAVIVNEAGEVGIDGALLMESGKDLPLALLSNGCVCCSLRDGMVNTIARLLDAPRPAGAPPLRRIVIETSGISRPGPMIASLADPELARRGLRVSVVCTFDPVAQNNPETDGRTPFEEASAQLAAANRIVVTKIDLVDADQIALATNAAQAFNPLARVIADSNRMRAVRMAFAPPDDAGDDLALRALQILGIESRLKQQNAHPRIRVLAGQVNPGGGWDEFAQWLDDLAGLCGERMLRLKALVRVTDCDDPIFIQSVGTTFSSPRRMTRHRQTPDSIIVITRDIEAAEINHHLPHACVTLEDARRSSHTPPRSRPLFESALSGSSHAIQNIDTP